MNAASIIYIITWQPIFTYMGIAFYLLCLTIFIFPFYIIRFSLPFFHFHIPTTLLEISFGLTFIACAVSFAGENFPFGNLKTKLDKYVLFFIFSATVALFSSYDFYGGIGIYKAYIIEPVLFYYCFIYILRKKNSVLPLYSFLVSILVLCLFGLLQKLTGSYSLAPNEIAQGRVSAVYNSANALALFIGPAVFICLALFLEVKKNTKYFFLFLAFFISVIILFTKSRGGLIAEVAGLFVFGYGIVSITNKQLKKYWYSVPLVFLLAISLFFFEVYRIYHNVYAYLYSSVNTNDTLEIRYLIWSGTINLIKARPFFGAGLDGFKNLYASHFRLSTTLEALQYPHNIVFNFWTELGFLGLCSMVLLFYKFFSVLLRSYFSKNPVFAVALVCVFVYWIMHGLVDVPYFKNDLSMEFWFMAALTQIPPVLRGRSRAG